MQISIDGATNLSTRGQCTASWMEKPYVREGREEKGRKERRKTKETMADVKRKDVHEHFCPPRTKQFIRQKFLSTRHPMPLTYQALKYEVLPFHFTTQNKTQTSHFLIFFTSSSDLRSSIFHTYPCVMSGPLPCTLEYHKKF